MRFYITRNSELQTKAFNFHCAEFHLRMPHRHFLGGPREDAGYNPQHDNAITRGKEEKA